MLKFYCARISVNVRRVWVALLEKQIPFEPVLLTLDGDQFEPDFADINPLQRIPVIVDDGLRVIESLAILDYLEAQYPSPPLMPKDPQAIAIVRMAEMVAVNELQPATIPLTKQMIGIPVEAQQLTNARQRTITVLQFYEDLLGDDQYMAGEEFTLAEVVAGTLIPSLPMFGIDLDAYPKLLRWTTQLAQRASWQQTMPRPEDIEAALPHVKKILETR